MKCLNKVSTINKKTKEYQSFPCGKCRICMQNRRNHWSFRLHQELKASKSAKFITLTYDEDNIPYNEETGEITLIKKDVQNFIKQYRKKEVRLKNNIRYFLTGEYGGKTDRPHYHIIMFNLTVDKKMPIRLQSSWKKGHIDIGDVNSASIHYITKYLMDTRFRFDKNYTRQKPFNLMSTKPGIGHAYIEKNKKFHIENKAFYGILNGVKIDLPRYYKELLFDEEDKRQHRIKMSLDVERKYTELSLKYGDPDLLEAYLKRVDKIKNDIEYRKMKLQKL